MIYFKIDNPRLRKVWGENRQTAKQGGRVQPKEGGSRTTTLYRKGETWFARRGKKTYTRKNTTHRRTGGLKKEIIRKTARRDREETGKQRTTIQHSSLRMAKTSRRTKEIADDTHELEQTLQRGKYNLKKKARPRTKRRYCKANRQK